MNILLVCAAGMSTSLLVNRMNDAAKAKGIELNIEAHPVGSIDSYGEQADVILLGPQVRFQKAQIEKLVADAGLDLPIDVINMKDYGMMNGKAVYEFALNLMKK